MILPVTFTFIALTSIAMFILVAWIGLTRAQLGVLRGDGGDPVLFKRIRVHANFVETAPLFALTLGTGEAVGLGAGLLWLAVISYGLGRIGHHVLYDSRFRVLPMTLTVAPSGLIGLWVLYRLWIV